MELKFIWIKEFRNIRETGFSFDNSEAQQFEYVDGHLRISRRERPPDGFFGNTVQSCTAIVGQNGSGKTSLTDFILHAIAGIANGAHVQWYEDHVYRSIIVLGNYIECHESIELLNKRELESQGFVVNTFSSLPFLDTYYTDENGLSIIQNKFVYYNWGFSTNHRGHLDNAIDISTDFLIYDDSRWQPWHTPPTGPEDYKTFLYHYLNMEAWREARFIFDYGGRLPFQLPNGFSVHLEDHELYRLIREKEELREARVGIDFRGHISEIIFGRAYAEDEQHESAGIRRWIRRRDQYEGYVMFFLNIIAAQALLTGALSVQEFERHAYRFIFESGYFPRRAAFAHLNAMKRNVLALRALVLPGEIDLTNYNKDRSVQATVQSAQWCISYGIFEWNTPQEEALLKQHIFEAFEFLKPSRVFYFGHSGSLSAGEKALLTFYARLYYAKYLIDRDIESDEGEAGHYHIKLFLDEPEIHLHPEWQRRFFKETLEFLQELFPDQNVQLFITSHSPLILSDIPATNAIILSKDTETGQLRLGNIRSRQTFAANIHALYADQFFLDSTIGAFAAEKIQWLSGEIEAFEGGVQEYQRLNALIDFIGEPVIRETLRQKLDARLPPRPQNEEALQREIIRLRRILSINNLDDDLPGIT